MIIVWGVPRNVCALLFSLVNLWLWGLGMTSLLVGHILVICASRLTLTPFCLNCLHTHYALWLQVFFYSCHFDLNLFVDRIQSDSDNVFTVNFWYVKRLIFCRILRRWKLLARMVRWNFYNTFLHAWNVISFLDFETDSVN